MDTSTFDRSAGHSFDKPALHQQEGDQDWRNDEDCGGHDLSSVTAILTAQRVEADHGRLLIVTLQER
jgi:hypothetical protein